MSYQPLVAQKLKTTADVVGPAENCQFSAHTLASLDRWLKELGHPDIVHWNNGLHDVGHNPGRQPVQFPLETYISNLKQILAKIQRIGARILWATMTPVHPQRPFVTTAWSWRNSEIDAYNGAALALMRQESVVVNDLHALIASDVARYLADDMLHLSGAGQEACAQAVVSVVQKVLSASEQE